MRTDPRAISQLTWYTAGAIILAGSALLWASLESEAVDQQRIVLAIFGALAGGFVLVTVGEFIRPTAVSAQSPPQKTDGNNTGTSTGQQGGITGGTINIYPPRQLNNQQVIDQLALLMDQGNTIAHAWEATNDTDALKRDIVPWADILCIITFLRNSVLHLQFNSRILMKFLLLA